MNPLSFCFWESLYLFFISERPLCQVKHSWLAVFSLFFFFCKYVILLFLLQNHWQPYRVSSVCDYSLYLAAFKILSYYIFLTVDVMCLKDVLFSLKLFRELLSYIPWGRNCRSKRSLLALSCATFGEGWLRQGEIVLNTLCNVSILVLLLQQCAGISVDSQTST